jgi:NAD(P)-dependent dehydrogenase (short-subunit alcohol dehydrogenase family)
LRLRGKVAVVTGGGFGIGRGASTLFAAEGAKVVVVDWNETTGKETLSQIESAGGEGLFIRDINLKGSFFFAKAVARQMMDQGGGVILFTSSISGVSGEDDQVAYSATKGGIIALVTAMAKDLGRYNIRVNCLLPGPVDTQQFRDWMETKKDRERAMAESVDSTILKRMGTPADVADAALFLVSDDASWVTGIAMPVDGGYLVRH